LLKGDFQTRHIPVQVISTDDRGESAHGLGAWGVLAKPIPTREQLDAMLTELRGYVDQPVREVLVAGASEEQAAFLVGLLGGSDTNVTRAASPQDARERLTQSRFACVVIAAEQDGVDLDLVEELQSGLGAGAAVVLYAPEGSEPRERLAQVRVGLGRRLSRADSPARLLDLVSLLLHRPFAALPEAKRKLLEELDARDASLRGRKALIVDDDVRNIFALASVLEKQGMHVLSAENGKMAIELLQATPDVDVVLMDIMMPQMDGNETIALIRKMPRLQSLPIVAVTAKAMKGDREKTLEAGAWDYLSKPVEPERMLRVLRGWLRCQT
jgi:CheY-like chemotaxis protein